MKVIMDDKKFIPIIVIVLALVAVGIVFWYSGGGKIFNAPNGAVGTTKTVSEGVPKIQTNAAEKVPEVNPLDRANPFKYNNPLR